MNYPAPFSKNQYGFFWKCFDNWFNVAEGGKRGGKNVLTTMAFCTILEKHPSKLHLVAGVSTATARLNILDCDGFGVMNYFEGRCRTGKYENRDCLYVSTSTGEKIILISGGSKKGDEKLIKGNTYGTAYITEANECHPVFIQEVFDRTISSPNRKIFHDLNPKSPQHWYYTDVLDFHEEQQAENPDYGYNYGHFTIADNMSISDSQLREVLKTYDKNSVWYSRDIKGERIQATGLVYPNFDNAVETENRAYTRFIVSMDYGIQNPTAMLLWGLYEGIWYAVREYYHSGRETNEQKTDEEYYEALCELCGDVVPERIIVDPSASSFIALILHKGKYRVRKADNSVIEGIQHTASALADRRILINDCCENTIREFSLYSWDSDSIEDRVIKENDHCLTGDTLVMTADGEKPIKELVGTVGEVWSLNVETGTPELKPYQDVRMTRESAEIYEVELENGLKVKATADHRIFTRRGWVEIKDLRGDDEIACIGCFENALAFVKVKSVKKVGLEPVYNMEVEDNYNFAANGGIIVHNCMDALRYFAQTERVYKEDKPYKGVMY